MTRPHRTALWPPAHHQTQKERTYRLLLLLLNNSDKPGIIGLLGTLLGKYNVNIASMSLSRDTAGGQALTVLSLDSVPPQAVLDELHKDGDISNVKIVQL